MNERGPGWRPNIHPHVHGTVPFSLPRLLPTKLTLYVNAKPAPATDHPPGIGVCFLCLVDVVPVKNEDGLVIMFILNFEVMSDNKQPNQHLNHKLPPWLTAGRTRGFKLRLPSLRSLSNSKVSLEDPERGRLPAPGHPSPEVLALGELLSLPPLPPEHQSSSSSRGSSRPALLWPEDQRTLLGSERPPSAATSSLPAGQSSPRSGLETFNAEVSLSNCSLSQSRSRESFHSMRRASSVDDIEAMRPEGLRKYSTGRPIHSSTGAVNNKSNILNSTSDSDLMRYRTISKIPQITLNFVDFKPDPLITLPAGDMDIIAPCKLIDRTHQVTEKVTQVGGGGHPAKRRLINTMRTQRDVGLSEWKHGIGCIWASSCVPWVTLALS
ncbi:hypothetical protein UPYG_G00071210 [Umbra pygmaea]|uniref:Uncharacterized protein n=1 Tax=Umbra pygmaea TaxID=75934 RepID=A0ABD0XTC9_UMBPY